MCWSSQVTHLQPDRYFPLLSVTLTPVGCSTLQLVATVSHGFSWLQRRSEAVGLPGYTALAHSRLAHIAPLHCTAGSLHSTFTRRPAAKARLSRSDGSVRLHAFPPFERCSDSTIVHLRRRGPAREARLPGCYNNISSLRPFHVVSSRCGWFRLVAVGCSAPGCPSRAANALLVMTHTLSSAARQQCTHTNCCHPDTGCASAQELSCMKQLTRGDPRAVALAVAG